MDPKICGRHACQYLVPTDGTCSATGFRKIEEFKGYPWKFVIEDAPQQVDTQEQALLGPRR
jgi:hypothetical protein